MKRRWKMKLLKLLIACAVVCVQANGQKVIDFTGEREKEKIKTISEGYTLRIPTTSKAIITNWIYPNCASCKKFTFNDGNDNTIEILGDGSLNIKGDTCALITHLIQFSIDRK